MTGTTQSTPPAGVRPGEITTVLGGTLDAWGIAATLVDLARRGHVQIREADLRGPSRTPGDWELSLGAPAPPGGLSELERRLVDGIPASLGLSRSRLSWLSRTPAFASVKAGRRAVAADLVAKGWARKRYRGVRRLRGLTGVLLLLLGVPLALPIPGEAVEVDLVLMGAVVAIAGILLLVSARSAIRLTSSGVAVRQEAAAFRRYLQTVDASQVLHDRAEADYVECLPYAIALGMLDRWAEVVRRLERQGCRLPEQPWYGRAATSAEERPVIAFAAAMQGVTLAVAGFTQPSHTAGGSSGGGGGGWFGGSGGDGGGDGGGGW